MASFALDEYLHRSQELVDATLNTLLPEGDAFPPRLHQAMRYCLFAGGKRLRPILALAATEAVGNAAESIIREACALELIHTYTLIHDDLPSMDNDDYRRGCPATHKVFGEALAVLAGDALLTEGFKVLADGLKLRTHPPRILLEVIREVADACGSRGIIGGQVVDLESEGRTIAREVLEYIHDHKTGKLITASVMLGALLGRARTADRRRLRRYGSAIGRAFQVTDDILDVLGSSKKLGKQVGSDCKKGKATYPAILGMDEARRLQQELFDQAIEALQPMDERAAPLRAIARIIIERNR